VRLCADSGLAGAVQLLGGAGLAEWLAFRTDALTAFTAGMHDAIAAHAGRKVGLAVCPRTPAVATLAGYDYQRIAEHAEVVMPKLYYWHRGYDGLPGTWWRWAHTLTHWNPGLSVRDALAVTALLCGGTVPPLDSLADFDHLVTPEYVGELARTEAARVVAATGGRAQIVPWVDGGRAPHDGDPLSGAHLESTLLGAAEAGIDRVNYFNSNNMTAADWTVLSRICGQEWIPETGGWRPPDRPTL
jgi:hypothetical protein